MTFNAANGYYYDGAADTVFSNLNNYVNQASGGTVPTVAISGTTNIFIGSTSPTPTNITPAVTSSIAINSLTFTPTGSGALVSGAGTLTVNNGVTVQSGVAGTETISAPVALGGNQTWTVTDATSTLNDSGGISGAFGLTKAGAGTLILTSADTFSGPTVVNGGALRLANANSLGGSSSVTVNSGGALQLTGGLTFAATPTTLNGTGIAGAGALESVSGVNTYGGAITLGSNSTIGADAGSTLNLTGATLAGSGFTLTLAGAGNINVSSVISGSGGLTVAGSGVDTVTGVNTFTGATTIASGTLAIGTGGSLASSSGVNLTASGATFDISGSGANQTIQDLNGVAGTTINLGVNTLTAGTNNASADVFAGVIQGTGGFTKVGTDTLTLGGTNTYTGATTVTAGNLQVNGSTAAGSAVAVNSGATLSGSGTVNGTTTVTSGTVAGNGLTLVGLLTFNGANNTLSGTETASGGTTVSANATVTQTGTLTSNLTDNGSTTLNGALTGNAIVAGTLAGSGSVSGTTTVNSGTINGSGLTLTGLVTFNGAGNTLSGTETATNGVTVATGATVTQTAGTLTGNLTDSGTTNLNGTLHGNATINSGGTIAGSGTVSGTTNVNNGILNGSGLTLTGLTTFLTGASNTLQGTINATGGVLVDSSATIGQTGTLVGNLTTAGTANIDGALTGNAAVNSGGTLAGDGSVSGTTSVNNGTVNGTGAGLTLTGLTTFQSGAGNVLSGTVAATGGVSVAGVTTVVNQSGTTTGNLTTAGTANINGTLAGNATVSSGGTLGGTNGTVNGTTTVTGGTVTGTNLTLTGALTFNGGSNTLSGSETATAGVAITGAATVNQSGTLTGSVNDTSSGASTFAGTIAGPTSTVTLNNAAGTLTLSGANSYGGGTTLTSGTLDVTGAGTLGSATSALNVGGGTLDLGGTTQVLGTVDLTGASTLRNGTLAGTSYNSSEASGIVTVNTVLSGNTSALTQTGAGTLLLAAANTYGGGTTISHGTVLIGNSNALGTGLVTQSGGTLTTAGTGGIQINLPGGFMQTGGTLTLQLNAAPVAGRNAANDFLNVTGNATLNGTLAVKFNFVPLKGDTFDLINATTLSGTGLADPVISPAGFKVSVAQTANDESITVTQTSLALKALLAGGATPNQSAILDYIDNNVVSGPLFDAISSTAGAGGALSATTAAEVADEFDPVKFANMARVTVFNNAVFSTQMHDNYIASGITTNGDFAASNGQINSSGLTVAAPGMDSTLAGIGSQLLAWSPAPLSHGMLSDSPAPVLGGTDMRDQKAMSTPGPTTGNNINVYVAGNVVLAQTFSQPDLDHSDQTTGGVQVGADYRITPHLRAGAMFSYNHTDADLDNNGSKATLDSYAPGVYAAYAQDGWYGNALAVYGFNNFTEDRHIGIGGFSAVAHGAPSGDQITGNIDGGYDFHLKALTYGPTLGLQYTHLDVNAYTEDGANALAADESISKQEADSLRSRLGAHASYDFHTGKVVLTPHILAAWQHEFLDQAEGLNASIISPATTGAAPFTVRTPNPSRDSALLDCGLNAQLCGQVSVFGDYLVQVGQSNYFGQSVQAGVKIGF